MRGHFLFDGMAWHPEAEKATPPPCPPRPSIQKQQRDETLKTIRNPRTKLYNRDKKQSEPSPDGNNEEQGSFLLLIASPITCNLYRSSITQFLRFFIFPAGTFFWSFVGVMMPSFQHFFRAICFDTNETGRERQIYCLN